MSTRPPFTAAVFKAVGPANEVAPEDGVTFSLKEAQAHVGGNIEILRPPRGRGLDGLLAVVNEDGIRLNLPENVGASAMMGMIILGDVLLCKEEMFE